MKSKNIIKLIVFVLLLAAAFWLVRHFGLVNYITGMKEWIKAKGFIGIIIFILIYILCVVLVMPGLPVTVLAGIIFGTITGVITVSIASTIGVAITFFISRYMARDAVYSWISKNKKFTDLDSLTEKNGPLIVAVTRLIPLFPFNLLNYGFGLTKVRFWDYILWSWLCMLPGTILYVAGADAFVKAAKEGRVPWLIVGIIAAMIVLIFLLALRAGRMLKNNGKKE